MPHRYDRIITKLTRRPLSQNEFLLLLDEVGGLFSERESELEIIKGSGIPLVFAHDKVYLKTTLTPICEERFCIVDIETNGHNPFVHQPIEIGAIVYQGGKICGTFHSFVFCEEIPEYITKLTGITSPMLEKAPKIHQVLETFKLFLGDCVFVAHNVSFDYQFLSNALYHYGFGYLYNPRLCTIKLAKKTFTSPRYSLEFLNEFLEIRHSPLHRALEDSKVALEVFKKSLESLDKKIYTSHDLIKFTEHIDGGNNANPKLS
ncbi:MAG: 3'-5' exonuclease [Helicobacter sp.]|uniref:3'-5' exonuclease n=1 Tax=Helicobacter sp. TaxID=218 RepID=UPI002A91392E|nr:3'-5' exonuclease [Helicobacter sp.]MDY5616232.1 3'-5' exonuclease [Helicobacter sp.]